MYIVSKWIFFLLAPSYPELKKKIGVISPLFLGNFCVHGRAKQMAIYNSNKHIGAYPSTDKSPILIRMVALIIPERIKRSSLLQRNSLSMA